MLLMVLDPADDSFRLVDISAQLRGRRKISGAALAANGKIIFAPDDADGVGIIDPIDDSFRLVDIGGHLEHSHKPVQHRFRLVDVLLTNACGELLNRKFQGAVPVRPSSPLILPSSGSPSHICEMLPPSLYVLTCQRLLDPNGALLMASCELFR